MRGVSSKRRLEDLTADERKQLIGAIRDGSPMDELRDLGRHLNMDGRSLTSTVLAYREQEDGLAGEPGDVTASKKRKLDDLSKADVKAIKDYFRSNPTADPREYGEAHNINLRSLKSIIRDSAARVTRVNGNGREPQPAAEPEPETAVSQIVGVFTRSVKAAESTPETDTAAVSSRKRAVQPDRRALTVSEEEYHDLLRRLDQQDEPEPAAEPMTPAHPDYDAWRRGPEAADLPAFWRPSQPPATNGTHDHVGAQTITPSALGTALAELGKLARDGRVSGRVSIQLDLNFEIGGE